MNDLATPSTLYTQKAILLLPSPLPHHSCRHHQHHHHLHRSPFFSKSTLAPLSPFLHSHNFSLPPSFLHRFDHVAITPSLYVLFFFVVVFRSPTCPPDDHDVGG